MIFFFFFFGTRKQKELRKSELENSAFDHEDKEQLEIQYRAESRQKAFQRGGLMIEELHLLSQ